MAKTITIPGVGVRLRELRELQGRTLRDVAEGSGIDVASLSNYERDETNLSIDKLELIANAIGCEPEAVLLHCLKDRFPKLRDSKLGRELDRMAARIKAMDRAKKKRG
jgi:transcriptional regulator with XRE-family HTH domain